MIQSRVSANSFDPSRNLSDNEIAELIELATYAPTAFNAQNWRFIAVRSAEAKERLLPMAYGQQKVANSSVTFIVCGTMNIHLSVPTSLKPSVEAGIISQEIYEGWVGASRNMYQDNSTFQRDEAIRSATFAGMSLMLAAQGLGLVSGPMIGFDPVAVSKAFGLAETDIPVMLISVGYPGTENWPQKPRKAVSEVLTLA
ncbi:nitroreductase family protein [Rhizobium grahamii]|uniref:Nitroreductase family protein n=1 Tax=Rhizobium grahamii TaxID=1120045 RepID=A0A5Q0C8R0_9HYPH|nr:nitroreductase family protein [Rhizobium grahamii]QRM51460.1 nitroreductase family protein [Rhizobium sp. BG6]